MKQAIILAAGEGQRLRPFTITKPKAMISIADKPILAHVVEALAQIGIRNIVLVVGYKREQVFDFMGNGERFGIEVSYVTQEKQLGTAHALAQAKSLADTEFLVLPGDKLIEAATLSDFMDCQPQAILLKRVEKPLRYGVVTVENGTVVNIVEKPTEAQSSLINTGIYAFTREIFSYIDPELGIPDALNNMIAQGIRLQTCETENTWLDVVYPWDILSLNSAILHKIQHSQDGTIESGVFLSGAVSIGKDTVIRSNSYIVGPVIIGEGCDIGPNTVILPATSIARNVVIAPFTEIENSVINDDVNIGPGSIIQDSVIDKGCNISGHFTACSDEAEIKVNNEHHVVKVGAMLGEGCNVGNSVTAQPGVIVGNQSQVKALKLISGRLPNRSCVL
ncbi:MAG: NTP transferase domain-containing protein [Chloroflexi bacterium]|nr:NTP transferase domain-containing protein [Chloroflexota bacterium]